MVGAVQVMTVAYTNDASPGAPNMDWLLSQHGQIITWSTVRDEITYPFPNFNGCTAAVCEWISNFIPQFIMDVITYSCSD